MTSLSGGRETEYDRCMTFGDIIQYIHTNYSFMESLWSDEQDDMLFNLVGVSWVIHRELSWNASANMFLIWKSPEVKTIYARMLDLLSFFFVYISSMTLLGKWIIGTIQRILILVKRDLLLCIEECGVNLTNLLGIQTQPIFFYFRFLLCL